MYLCLRLRLRLFDEKCANNTVPSSSISCRIHPAWMKILKMEILENVLKIFSRFQV